MATGNTRKKNTKDRKCSSGRHDCGQTDKHTHRNAYYNIPLPCRQCSKKLQLRCCNLLVDKTQMAGKEPHQRASVTREKR